VFKKLDKLIIKTFIGPFIATFFIALFVVVIQFFWKYIDEMVGKGIDAGALLKLIGVVCLQTGVLFALPIAVLLSSLMTFGNLGESFELVAIKSSGISLLRFMRPLFVVVLFLCGLAFLFNNYVIPKANLKFYTMLQDIRYSRPAFDLKPGQFYRDIDNYAILVDQKNDKTNGLKNVFIYENSNNQYQDNVILADSGVMSVSADRQFLEFRLFNGGRFQERGTSLDLNTEYIRLYFKEYKKLFDISALLFKQSADSNKKDWYKMLNLTQLNRNIDSLRRTPDYFVKKVKPLLSSHLHYLSYADTGWRDIPDTGRFAGKPFGKIIPDSLRHIIYPSVAEKFNSLKNQMEIESFDYKNRMDSLRYHTVEWHRKFTFSVICLVMFLIGAPLGSIIRRGGLGTPLLFAVLFFVVYFILFTIGEKSANTGVMSPWAGMWLPVMVLVPIGIFLTRKAMQDSQLFNSEFYYKLFRPIKKMIDRRRKTVVKDRPHEMTEAIAPAPTFDLQKNAAAEDAPPAGQSAVQPFNLQKPGTEEDTPPAV
jgi:lipopolysaccharide export system permease protein